mmetsp:Transcript_145525/g.466388  ORF Transcript_145525/g.466388 Transcript_145525/m.466388 type:complete len:464 (-) Transcript_145525:3453-4844(-)
MVVPHERAAVGNGQVARLSPGALRSAGAESMDSARPEPGSQLPHQAWDEVTANFGEMKEFASSVKARVSKVMQRHTNTYIRKIPQELMEIEATIKAQFDLAKFERRTRCGVDPDDPDFPRAVALEEKLAECTERACHLHKLCAAYHEEAGACRAKVKALLETKERMGVAAREALRSNQLISSVAEPLTARGRATPPALWLTDLLPPPSAGACPSSSSRAGTRRSLPSSRAAPEAQRRRQRQRRRRRRRHRLLELLGFIRCAGVVRCRRQLVVMAGRQGQCRRQLQVGEKLGKSWRQFEGLWQAVAVLAPERQGWQRTGRSLGRGGAPAHRFDRPCRRLVLGCRCQWRLWSTVGRATACCLFCTEPSSGGCRGLITSRARRGRGRGRGRGEGFEGLAWLGSRLAAAGLGTRIGRPEAATGRPVTAEQIGSRVALRRARRRRWRRLCLDRGGSRGETCSQGESSC